MSAETTRLFHITEDAVVHSKISANEHSQALRTVNVKTNDLYRTAQHGLRNLHKEINQRKSSCRLSCSELQTSRLEHDQEDRDSRQHSLAGISEPAPHNHNHQTGSATLKYTPRGLNQRWCAEITRSNVIKRDQTQDPRSSVLIGPATRPASEDA